MIDRFTVYRTIDKRDRIGLLGVFNALVEAGCERWEALAWCYWIAPVHIKKRIRELIA
jgi:hypothetical protein